MGLNQARGNMYNWVDYTWNTIKGQCPHDCKYCYMKRFGKQQPFRFDEKELKTDLGNNNTIFVGNSNDMFAQDIPVEWIEKTMEHCNKFDNRYVFQTKNPKRLTLAFNIMRPRKYIVGTTIETNRDLSKFSKAPNPQERAKWISYGNDSKFVTVEPIMDFDLDAFFDLLVSANPDFINIGADSRSCNLPEPSGEKILRLIQCLEHERIHVKRKSNLKRLL